MTPDAVARAFRWACATELRALKPGNVHVYRDGHGMTVAQFRRSARAAAPWLAQPGLTVGARILAATLATRAAVGINTNLGIVLLAAPLCQAAMASGRGDLRDRLKRTLARLTVADARLAYAAIAHASPAGLGTSRRADVRDRPRVTLLNAMRLAAGRDRVARQYAAAFADIFDLGVAQLEAARRTGVPIEAAATTLHMTFLRRFPDSHVARKFGRATAAALRREAKAVPDTQRALLQFDRSLKRRGLNPGTTADLVVASLLAYRLTSIVPPAA